MKISVNRNVWMELGLDDAAAMEIAVACFYLGFGLYETKRLIKLGLHHEDVLRVLELAVDCGLRKDDYVISLGA